MNRKSAGYFPQSTESSRKLPDASTYRSHFTAKASALGTSFSHFQLNLLDHFFKQFLFPQSNGKNLLQPTRRRITSLCHLRARVESPTRT
ncbi:hypothetical protein JMJ78_0000883 [Colletotrichum scovillei]|nr:hypothetical protein JMJ78_0000883 [Colletotrichum scovillei]